jgi:hypothetical protein
MDFLTLGDCCQISKQGNLADRIYSIHNWVTLTGLVCTSLSGFQGLHDFIVSPSKVTRASL